MLQHQHPVTDPETEGATRPPFTGHNDDDRYRQGGHLDEVVGNGFRLSPLFSINSRVRPRSIDKGDDRSAELCADLHDPKRFAVTLRTRHAEVPAELLGRVPSFLVTEDDDRLAIETSESGDHGRIVRKRAVAVAMVYGRSGWRASRHCCHGDNLEKTISILAESSRLA